MEGICDFFQNLLCRTAEILFLKEGSLHSRKPVLRCWSYLYSFSEISVYASIMVAWGAGHGSCSPSSWEGEWLRRVGNDNVTQLVAEKWMKGEVPHSHQGREA